MTTEISPLLTHLMKTARHPFPPHLNVTVTWKISAALMKKSFPRRPKEGPQMIRGAVTAPLMMKMTLPAAAPPLQVLILMMIVEMMLFHFLKGLCMLFCCFHSELNSLVLANHQFNAAAMTISQCFHFPEILRKSVKSQTFLSHIFLLFFNTFSAFSAVFPCIFIIFHCSLVNSYLKTVISVPFCVFLHV